MQCYACGIAFSHYDGRGSLRVEAQYEADRLNIDFCFSCSPALRVVALSVKQIVAELRGREVSEPRKKVR